MAKQRKAKILFFSCSLLAVLLTTAGALLLIRGCERNIETETVEFRESARELSNPNRGFYHLYVFSVTDEKQDYPQMVTALYEQDTDTRLTLIQICLKAYRQGAISKQGLSNLEALLKALSSLNKQLIVRFTYDSEGRNEQYEPESLDIILIHMEQLCPILRRYSDQIFTLQGLFIGNWGEMNGTRYDSEEDLRRLAQKLAGVTEPSVYLAVRSPAQWRSIMESQSPVPENQSAHSLFGRLGLFNDGMLGNASDYGTYRTGKSTDENGSFPRWEREEELVFQDWLCCQVPNGGEVIHENRYNDLDQAILDLERMHVTYLNQTYDPAVLEKWARTVITEEGCFRGMDGLSYVERRLGYRLAIVSAGLVYQNQEDALTVAVTLKNAGFAPLYREPRLCVTLYDERNNQSFAYPFQADLQILAGGSQKEKTVTVSLDIPLQEFREREYQVYFSIVDVDTEEPILLANEQSMEKLGYRIGRFWQ